MQLSQKIAETTDLIRKQPNNPDHRLHYIQYLCMSADWEKALKQLVQFKKIFPFSQQQLISILIELVEGEMRREAVFQAQQKPRSWIEDREEQLKLQQQLSLIGHLTENNLPEAIHTHTLLAEMQRPRLATIVLTGRKDPQKSITPWLMDGDMRTAFVCEFFLGGYYFWQSWDVIQRLDFEAPKSLPDIIWRSAELHLRNGQSLQVICPARYVVNSDYTNPLLCNQETHWHDLSDEWFTGSGQKILYGEEAEYGFLDLRSLVFE